MSLTVSQDKGVTVITINSNPNNKWPILCQILGSLCHSPVCAVSQHVKAKMTEICTALGVRYTETDITTKGRNKLNHNFIKLNNMFDNLSLL